MIAISSLNWRGADLEQGWSFQVITDHYTRKLVGSILSVIFSSKLKVVEYLKSNKHTINLTYANILTEK